MRHRMASYGAGSCWWMQLLCRLLLETAVIAALMVAPLWHGQLPWQAGHDCYCCSFFSDDACHTDPGCQASAFGKTRSMPPAMTLNNKFCGAAGQSFVPIAVNVVEIGR